MRSDIRGLIVSILLFLLWGTVLVYPFRTVSDLISQTTQTVAGKLPLPAFVFAILVLLVVMGLTCVALFFGRSEISDALVLCFSSCSCILYCVQVIKTRSFSIEAAFVALVTVLSVTLVVLKKTEITRYLADCFIFALPVSMFYECVMNPLYRLLKLNIYKFSPFIVVPQKGIFSKVGNLLHLPLVVWGTFFFILTLLPVMYLAGGRKEGKIKK
ncbi:MAG: hypothetical protein J6Y08_07300 [Clostridiales bacterium]|nr:hypothetical protein [Clostridiales bacterium]